MVEFSEAVDRVSCDVHNAAADLGACRHRDGGAGAAGFQASLKAVSRVHSDTAKGVFANVLLDFYDEFASVGTCDFEGVVNPREYEAFAFLRDIEVDVDDRADNL